MRYIVTILAVFIASIANAQAGDVAATAEWTIFHSKKAPPIEAIKIKFKEKGSATRPPLDSTKGAPLSKASYKIVASKGDSSQSFDISQIIISGAATEVLLIPKQQPKSDVTYTLTIAPGALQFTPTGRQAVFTPVELKLDNADLTLDETYLMPRGLKTKVEVAGGTAGAGSVQIHSGLTSFSNESLLSADFLAKADFSLLSRDKTKYVNSVVGELKLYNAFEWNPNNESFTGVLQWGVSSRIESDQTFRTVDGTVGAAVSSYIKNPLTTFLHGNVVKLLQGKELQEAGVAPYLFVSYDYVDHLKQGVSTDTGNERLRADFSWSLPLLRGFEFPRTLGVTQQVFDADFLADVEVIYDFHSSKLMDNSKLTLEFRPEMAADKAPSFTLTYARGKATPTFKNFDAFLAGMKIPF